MRACKKSLLDYILKDEDEKEKLEIYTVEDQPIEYGEGSYKF